MSVKVMMNADDVDKHLWNARSSLAGWPRGLYEVEEWGDEGPFSQQRLRYSVEELNGYTVYEDEKRKYQQQKDSQKRRDEGKGGEQKERREKRHPRGGQTGTNGQRQRGMRSDITQARLRPAWPWECTLQTITTIMILSDTILISTSPLRRPCPFLPPPLRLHTPSSPAPIKSLATTLHPATTNQATSHILRPLPAF